MRITRQCFFFYRFPPAPWADTGVEVDQCLFVSRRCAIRSGDTSYQGNPEQNGEEIQYPCVGNSEFHDDCRYYSGSHSPEITFTVETPPMPFQYVGCDVSTKECAYNPLEDFINIFQKESDNGADHYHCNRNHITAAYLRFYTRFRIDVFQINVIHYICRSRIHR